MLPELAVLRGDKPVIHLLTPPALNSPALNPVMRPC